MERHNRKIAWLTKRNVQFQKVQLKEKYVEEVQFEFPGWKQITSNGKGSCHKMIWTAIVLASFIICVYQISNRIALFASNPIQTEIIVQQNRSVKFPSFIICPVNHEISQALLRYKTIISNETGGENGVCAVTLDQIMKRFNLSLFTVWSRINVEHLVAFPIKLWRWDEKRKEARKIELVTEDLPTVYGICKKLTIPELVPFRKEITYLPLGSDPKYDGKCHTSSSIIFHIFVRDDYEHVKYRPFSDVISTQRSTQKLYGITAKQFEYLNTAENPCSTYEMVKTCRNRCLDKILLNETCVTCKLPDSVHLNLPNCTTAKEFQTISGAAAISAAAIDYRKDCNCPRPCRETIYATDFKYTDGNSHGCGVTFYFDDNKIDLMREYYSYTIIPLLCDIGGNLGLFLGLCIPTVLENIQNSLLYFKRKILYVGQ